MCVREHRWLQRTVLPRLNVAQCPLHMSHLYNSRYSRSSVPTFVTNTLSRYYPSIPCNSRFITTSTASTSLESSTSTESSTSSFNSLETANVMTSTVNTQPLEEKIFTHMPRRFVRRWYIPGMEEDHSTDAQEQVTNSRSLEDLTREEQEEEKERLQKEGEVIADKGGGEGSVSQVNTHNNAVDTDVNAIMKETSSLQTILPLANTDKDTNKSNITSEDQESVTWNKHETSVKPASQDRISELKTIVNDNTNNNNNNSSKSEKLSAEKAALHNASFATDTDGSPLPFVLLHDLEQDNKKMKKLLMVALGKEFARAGLYTDGLQTSFSVVNYHELKERTGLTRIPNKLLLSCLTIRGHDKDWIDISAHPTATVAEYREALHKTLINLGVKRDLVEDSTAELQLPHALIVNTCNVLVLRYAIEIPSSRHSISMGGSANSFQDLTNRFTLYMMPKRCITVHRTHCTFVEELKLHWNEMCANEDVHDERFFVHYFVKATIYTFNKALASCVSEFDLYEANLFASSLRRSSLAREIYHIKRRASVYGRALTLIQDAFTHAANALQLQPYHVRYQEIQHDLAHIHALADSLNSNADSVLQILFQLSSYQVNELMRVLTLFSAFFIPLSFIAAVYGMNFDSLPLLHTSHGEVYCGALMSIVACTIYIWFKVNRFI